METVACIVFQVVEVHERGLAQVVVGELELAHLGGNNGLSGGRQRGVTHSNRFIVCEVALLLFKRESVTTEMHGEDEVCLFDDLFAVKVEIREMQEQRVLV